MITKPKQHFLIPYTGNKWDDTDALIAEFYSTIHPFKTFIGVLYF
jgi:hypothetical protein